MQHHATHIAKKLKATAALLLLLLCVCSAVARDTTLVFSKLPTAQAATAPTKRFLQKIGGAVG